MLNFKIEYHTRWGESLALVGADDKVWPDSERSICKIRPP